MITIHHFTFNGFQENTYLLYDETKECVIIDPGCYSNTEQQELVDFIEKEGLKPVKLLNTHCHIDHILGNNFVSKTFNIGLEMHEKDLPTLHTTTEYGHLYGFTVDQSPEPTNFLNEGDIISFGNSTLDILFVPGHAPGHIVFVNHEQKFAINGDVLFYGSIGRTDLPGGDHQTLINSIKTKIFALPNDFTIYTGHGPATTIGFEKANNPFLQ
ncbi:MBL fold metallo-hydrolase [Vicingus serpentipes]|uniref:MBL fold metallo-hydrolase n=1 Tax=Vicingus serpentipes TaxID=1926625 RepID=A0A5C6RVC9_9FLAO|nr:MBL fold metallo-hydrolase [Vicingus serpentipes]TXB65925.1 MBL fold metallo-hydrolase [Vicingus serpentipes]